MAARWRDAGGRVVGLVGQYAPREVVLAAGMLPIRLRSDRLVRPEARVHAADAGPRADALEGLAGELPHEQLSVISALLRGELDWVDALLIGRDNEAHIKLFYLLREMAADPQFRPSIPPFAFSDGLRLPSRTSAVYNRLRLRELQQAVAGWAQREPAPEDLSAAIDAEIRIAGQLQELERARAAERLSGSETLTARRGADVLPPAEAASALAGVLALAETRSPLGDRPRIFVTGSDPDVEIYRAIEAAGFSLVADEQGGDAVDPIQRIDPIDWLADRYQYRAVAAARAGLDRVALSVERARVARADAVVQLLVSTDEASEWELEEFRSLLPTTAVIAARLDPGAEDQAVAGLVSDLAGLGANGGRSAERVSDGGVHS